MWITFLVDLSGKSLIIMYMKICKKISEMSTSSAIVTAGILVSLSIFLTTWIFFGGDNNRQKLFVSNPQVNRNVPPQNTLTPQQLQQMQQQREAMMKQASSTPGQIKVATTSPVKK